MVKELSPAPKGDLVQETTGGEGGGYLYIPLFSITYSEFIQAVLGQTQSMSPRNSSHNKTIYPAEGAVF